MRPPPTCFALLSCALRTFQAVRGFLRSPEPPTSGRSGAEAGGAQGQLCHVVWACPSGAGA